MEFSNHIDFGPGIDYNTGVVDIKKSWDKIADHYNSRYRISSETVHFGPLCPGEDRLRIIGDIRGKKAVDLGCGGGQNAVALSKMGAEVTAIDFSQSQIKIARRLAADNNRSIRFVKADISAVSFLRNECCDMVISACAISFVRDVGRVFDEVFRILKTGGRFILSDMNPLQYIIDQTENGFEFNNRYTQRPIRINWSWEFERLNNAPKFSHYVRPISEYYNYLAESGFHVSRILEPESTLDTPHKGFSEEIMEEYPYIAKHIPITFVFLCEKR